MKPFYNYHDTSFKLSEGGDLSAPARVQPLDFFPAPIVELLDAHCNPSEICWTGNSPAFFYEETSINGPEHRARFPDRARFHLHIKDSAWLLIDWDAKVQFNDQAKAMEYLKSVLTPDEEAAHGAKIPDEPGS